MPSVADCLRQHATAYLKQFGDRVPLGHRKVLSLITRCRTGELGGVVYQCESCGTQHWTGRSCGNRHCPNCQKEKTSLWLAKQTDKLLPVPHFLVTFTVPSELRMLLRAQQRTGYNALFQSGSETIRKLLANPKYLGSSNVGFMGVLHTWGRDPTVYHPHLHFVVPAGGVNDLGTAWLSTPENFLFSHTQAISLYKKQFADAMRAAGLYDQVPRKAWRGKWVVDIEPVGDGRAVLKYLAPYVYRVAISDNRIVACDERNVTFKFTPSGARESRTRTVPGHEFVRGFAQHILPGSFQKVRYYGWMSSNSKTKLDLVRWLVSLYLGWIYWLTSGAAPQEQLPEREPFRCAACGSQMKIIDIINADCRVLVEHSVAYLDSG